MRQEKRDLTVKGMIYFLLFAAVIFVGLRASEKISPANPADHDSKNKRLGKQIYIEPGEYWLGSDKERDNQPVRSVSFKGFYIDIHPVSNAQYVEFLSKSAYVPKGKFNRDKAKDSPNLPATHLTYEDAAAYASFYKKRLPTEWEWEIAARSLKKENIYASPNTAPRDRGHFLNDKKYFKLPIFSYPANELGLYGMAGNVFEWTSSEYEKKYLHGRHFQQYRVMVLRGGAWTNRVFDIRTTTRTPFPAQRCLDWLGFRCVSDLPGGFFSRKPPPWTPRKSFLLKTIRCVDTFWNPGKRSLVIKSFCGVQGRFFQKKPLVAEGRGLQNEEKTCIITVTDSNQLWVAGIFFVFTGSQVRWSRGSPKKVNFCFFRGIV